MLEYLSLFVISCYFFSYSSYYIQARNKIILTIMGMLSSRFMDIMVKQGVGSKFFESLAIEYLNKSENKFNAKYTIGDINGNKIIIFKYIDKGNDYTLILPFEPNCEETCKSVYTVKDGNINYITQQAGLKYHITPNILGVDYIYVYDTFEDTKQIFSGDEIPSV